MIFRDVTTRDLKINSSEVDLQYLISQFLLDFYFILVNATSFTFCGIQYFNFTIFDRIVVKISISHLKMFFFVKEQMNGQNQLMNDCFSVVRSQVNNNFTRASSVFTHFRNVKIIQMTL